jgi:vacuolar-type H+-ATPase catalytic subunit A/Vma1
MKTLLAALLAGACAALPLTASADTSPLVNRVIVDQALQQQMQNQLNTQQTQLQTQRDLMRANLQSQMQQQQLQMQYLLLQQQIELLKIQQRARAHSSVSHRRHHGH